MKSLLLSFLITCSIVGFSQDETAPEKIKRMNISFNAGFPSLTGINLEYIISKANNRFSITSDIGYLPISRNSYSSTFSYFSLGGNYHFSKKGKGLYFGMDFGVLPINTTKVEGKIVDYNANFTSLNSKFGIKAGKSVFFKMEVGYSLFFYDLEDANEYLSNTYGFTITPSIDFLQLLNGKMGVGFSF